MIDDDARVDARVDGGVVNMLFCGAVMACVRFFAVWRIGRIHTTATATATVTATATGLLVNAHAPIFRDYLETVIGNLRRRGGGVCREALRRGCWIREGVVAPPSVLLFISWVLTGGNSFSGF